MDVLLVLLEAVAQLVKQHLLVRRVTLQRFELVRVEFALVEFSLQPSVVLLHQLHLIAKLTEDNKYHVKQ